MKQELPEYLLQPLLPLTITVIGAGGSGSMFLQHLARLVHAYQSINRRRIVVTVCDGDKVSDANVGRQAYGYNEIGSNKADLIVSRINRFYGFEWIAVPEYMNFKRKDSDNYMKLSSNFIVSAVDTVKARQDIAKFFYEGRTIKENHEYYPHFWIDMGNTKTTGLVMVASPELEWPDRFIYKDNFAPENNEPSCTLAMALNQQDLFINSQCALVAAKWLWEALNNKTMDWRGAFINLETFGIRKLKVETNAEKKGIDPGQSSGQPARKPAINRKRSAPVKKRKNKTRT